MYLRRMPRLIVRCRKIFWFLVLVLRIPVFAQGQLPYMNIGPNSAFAQIDFARLDKATQVWPVSEIDPRGAQPDAVSVSALDLQAPDKAVQQFNHAISLLKTKNSTEAIKSLQKAIEIYPDYISAHNALGVAFLYEEDARARSEFETAARLDERLPGPLLNLGILQLSTGDFAGANTNLTKAAALTPDDPKVLTALAFAQNCEQRYEESMRTALRVHTLEHSGLANVHYIAASAAISLHDFAAARQELNRFLAEDQTNPLSPIARANLEDLENGKGQFTQQTANDTNQRPVGREMAVLATGNYTLQTFPNSERLRSELSALEADDADVPCINCETPPDPFEAGVVHTINPSTAAIARWSGLYTIHQAVDETALYFSVSQHGQMVTDLSLSNIEVLDDKKRPQRIMQFTPQSQLPLRLGLLIDISDSVEKRFAFEKRAAERFIEQVLTGKSDLAFVAGFNKYPTVTQDFTRDPAALAQGVDKLKDSGETAIFDAVSFGCWKLAAYPDQGRVARVLVILTDGEDNSSARNLKQTMEVAEAAGVTVYTLSTSDKVLGPYETDANRILKVLAEGSGGEAIFPGDLRSLDDYLNKLPAVIRSRYLIAYRPADFVPDGRYRSVHVSAEKDGKHLRVHARRGYYARLAQNAH